MKNRGLILKKIFVLLISTFILLTTIHSVGTNVVMRLSAGIKPTFYQTFSFDSNILMAIVSLITIIYVSITFKKEDINMPRWLANIYLGGVTSIMFTFLIVMVYLGPFIEGFEHMLSAKLIFLHLFNPLLALANFCFVQKEEKISIKEFYIGLIPMFVYSIFYIINTYILGVWKDIYRLNAGGLGFVIVPGMIILIGAISIGVIALRNIKYKTKETN